MWGIFAGIALWGRLPIRLSTTWQTGVVPIKKRLATMRRHASMGHRWDPFLGRWLDE